MLILSRVISTALASALCVALAACPEAPEATTDTADVSADAAVACDPAAPSLGVDQLSTRKVSHLAERIFLSCSQDSDWKSFSSSPTRSPLSV